MLIPCPMQTPTRDAIVPAVDGVTRGLDVERRGHRTARAMIALAASGVLRSSLYDVSATDPLVFIVSSFSLAAIALAGYVIPAARGQGLSLSRLYVANNFASA